MYVFAKSLLLLKLYFILLPSLLQFTTSIVHSNLDYCNSLYYDDLPYSQLNRLQQIQNCLARAVPKFTHTTPILKSLHLHSDSESDSLPKNNPN